MEYIIVLIGYSQKTLALVINSDGFKDSNSRVVIEAVGLHAVGGILAPSIAVSHGGLFCPGR
jgi:hypothetical protein